MIKDDVNLKIDGIEIITKPGNTVLQAAQENGIFIPNLCHNPDLKPFGACRLCLVENEEGKLVTACETLVEDGREYITENDIIHQVRKMMVKLIIANHQSDCLICSKDNNCKLQEVSAYLDVKENDLDNFRRKVPDIPIDTSNPFFHRDLKKCILCGICSRVCQEVIGVSAIDFAYRGYDTKISTSGDKPIIDSSCISCGECVEHCPVGALIPKNNIKPAREVRTICPYCGVGCGIILGIRGQDIVSVTGDFENQVNKGKLCVKGRYGYDFVQNNQRLKTPLINRNGIFEEVSWDEALSLIVDQLSAFKGDKFAAISSAKCTNEENYIFQKFTRVVMETNNIDHCARLCHAPSVAGLTGTLGSGAMTNSIEEIAQTDCILAIGTNTTSTHPIIGLNIIKAVNNGAKLLVANPRRIDLAKKADVFLQNYPGTDVALIMGMMHFIVEEELHNKKFINKRCENFSEFRESLEKFDPETVEEITGVNRDQIKKAAEIFALSENSTIIYAMGITQHSHGTDNVMAISNLSLLTGNLGRYATGVNPLRGQNNVQGACDMGALPDVFPGYQKVNDKRIKEKFEDFWDTDLSSDVGRNLPDILEQARTGRIRAMYIMGENPILSEPDADNVKLALENLDFLVVQDIFLTETAKLADVVLPASSFAEKNGTFTNTERRVQMIRQAIKPVEDSHPDWWIISQIASRMGYNGFQYNHESEIFKEMTAITPIYHGLSFERIDNQGIQWPCEEEQNEGTKFLHRKKFSTPTGKAVFMPLEYKKPIELPDDEYPFILTTQRSLYHYHTGTMSRKIEGLDKLLGQEYVELNSVDASELGLVDGDQVWVSSRRGKVKAQIKIVDELPRGIVSMTFHFAETPTNLLTSPFLDPKSSTPELKICAIRLDKITFN